MMRVHHPPIIYDVAIKNNIRPERPMAASSIGAQMGIIASPVSVAVVSLVAMLGNVTFDGRHLEFLDAGHHHSIDVNRYPGDRYLQLVPRLIKTEQFSVYLRNWKTVSMFTVIPRRCSIKNCRKATGWQCGFSSVQSL